MHMSKVVEVDGVFIGAALRLPGGQSWRFVSADRRTREADGAEAPSFSDARALAMRAYFLSQPDTGTRAARA